MSGNVAVIGAGAVGCAIALRLVRRGFAVDLIDRGEPGGGASHGNAGAIVPSPTPLATPDLLKSLPSMLLDRDGPVRLRASYLPKALPWLIRFLAEARSANAEANSRALHALTKDAGPAWLRLVRGTTAEALLAPNGWLKVYDTEAGFTQARKELVYADRRGSPYDLLSTDDLRQLEPALGKRFKHGILQPDALSTPNPRRLVETLASEAIAGGARHRCAEVTRLGVTPEGRPEVTTPTETLRPDRAILACGAWSKPLARQAGARVPLDTERGYHLMLPTPSMSLGRPTVWGEKSFVLCPMESGLRLTAGVEFAGLSGSPNYAFIERLLPYAQEMLPGLDATVQDRWLGFRPSIPDSRPMIGPAPASDSIILAFGHHHLGLTLAARTAELVETLITDGTPDIDMTLYRTDRYQRS